MTQINPARPRDGLALYFGIVLPQDVATRLDQSVLRTHARLAAALMSVPPPEGFTRVSAKAARDG
jgi:hypothetical protein